MKKTIALATILVAAFASTLFAVGEARITGTVVDVEQNPLAGVKITVEATEEKTFKQTYTTDKNGKFAIFLLAGWIPYKFTLEKEGYGTYEEVIKLKLIPEKNERTFTLAKGTVIPAGAVIEVDPAVVIYNEGVQLANSGDDAGAIAKFEEAIGIKPDLAAGWMAITRIYYRTGQHAKAIEAGNKALEFDPTEESILTILGEAYDKVGDKAKAAEFRKKAPANPAHLFNEAARLINAGDDGAAGPLLQQAIAADPAFAQAHYELGMIYVRSGKNAEAKASLEKYLEIEPNGKDAALAREMLGYLK